MTTLTRSGSDVIERISHATWKVDHDGNEDVPCVLRAPTYMAIIVGGVAIPYVAVQSAPLQYSLSSSWIIKINFTILLCLHHQGRLHQTTSTTIMPSTGSDVTRVNVTKPHCVLAVADHACPMCPSVASQPRPSIQVYVRSRVESRGDGQYCGSILKAPASL